jgi:hypothetical protein
VYNKTIIRNNTPYDILYYLSPWLFKNKDGSINKKVLGMFVAEVGADKVMEVNNKLLICKEVEDANYEEM